MLDFWNDEIVPRSGLTLERAVMNQDISLVLKMLDFDEEDTA